MSENRDEATGQFTPNEPAYGREGELLEAGYVPLPEETDAVEDDRIPGELTKDEAAAALEPYPTPEHEIKTYSALDGLDENVALTLEQAAEIASADREADEKQTDLDEDDKLRKEVDELRGEKKADKAEELPVQEQPPRDPSNPEIDPEIERALNNPKIKEAISAQVNEAESVKQRYSTAIDQADMVASAAFIAKYPELHGQPVENWQNVLNAMAPDRAQEAFGTINTLMRVKMALLHKQNHQAEAQRTRFRAASDSFEEKIKDVPKARRAEVESEIVAALKERSSDLGQVAKLLRAIDGSELVMGLLWELGDQRNQLRTLRNAPKAVAKPNLPPVQRPGVSSGRRSSDDSIASLNQRLSQSGSLDDAVKLRLAGMKQR